MPLAKKYRHYDAKEHQQISTVTGGKEELLKRHRVVMTITVYNLLARAQK